MAAASFFGHALLGLGPGIAFFVIIIAPKSFVVLLSLFSAFLWLVVLLLTSAVLRGFVPLAATQPAYAGALLTAVGIEELARYSVWRLHKKTVAVLHRMSVSSGHTFTPVDELYLAVGWGYGQAAVHVLIMFASLLPLTAGHGTLYTAACPQMSVFLVAALNSLGMGATLIALSVIAIDGWSRGSWAGRAYAPLVHAAAALLTLGSMHKDGCMKAVPAQLALGLVNSWYGATVAWRLGSSGGGRSNSSSVAAGNVSRSRAVGLGPVPVMVPAAAWTSGPEPLAESDAAVKAAAGSSQSMGLPGAVETAVLSPRNTGTAVLRSRAGQQASADVLQRSAAGS